MTKNYVCRTPYLSKHTSYNHVFCCTSLKDDISRCFYFFKILIFWVVMGGSKSVKKGPKWQKILSHSVSRKLYLIWLWLLVHMCKMMISPEFYFFKILIFRVFRSSSINAKRKFWGVPHLLHMCVLFYFHRCIVAVAK